MSQSQFFDIDNLFDWHRPDPNQALRMDGLRRQFKALARQVEASTVPGPEQTLAIRKLVDAQQQAIAAIAREGDKRPGFDGGAA